MSRQFHSFIERQFLSKHIQAQNVDQTSTLMTKSHRFNVDQILARKSSTSKELISMCTIYNLHPLGSHHLSLNNISKLLTDGARHQECIKNFFYYINYRISVDHRHSKIIALVIICDNLGSSNTVVGSAAQEDYLPHLPLTHYLSNPTLSHHLHQLYRLSRNPASNWQWQLDMEWPIWRKKLSTKRLKHCQRHNGPKALAFSSSQKVHQALKSW